LLRARRERPRRCGAAEQSDELAPFHSPMPPVLPQLRSHIDAFVGDYNERAKPFVWTKSEVHQKRLKARFADQ
jgi:hypothetical protein